MPSKFHRARRTEPAELQITAFMNLMVALVPFLLITAVFSQLAVIDLNLPDPDAQSVDQPPPRSLTVVIRESTLTVLDAEGPLREFQTSQEDPQLVALNQYLVEVKSRLPNENKITLLLEQDTPYEKLINVMDTVRVTGKDGQDLFPLISIGDAPASPDAGAAR